MLVRRLLPVALATLAVPMFSGCFFFDDWYDPDPYPYDPYEPPNEIPPPYNDGTLIVDASAQFGAMGDVRGYEADAVASYASYSGTYSSVRLDSLTDNYWVMSSLSFENLDLVNAPAGTYRSDPTGYYGGGTVYISMTGCSGPSYGNYTFDSTSQEVEVTIEDNADGSRSLAYRAIFQDYAGGSQVAEGSLVYRQGTVTSPPPSYGTYSITASDATQQGDMGSITTYSGPATASEGYYYGSSSSIRLDSVGADWWVMSYLSVNNFDIATAPAGTYTTTSATWDSSEPQVTVTGCSGPSYGNYTFDTSADEVEMVVSDNEDGSRNLQITARFGSQIAQASFRYTVAM